jgi:hypothetical protein
LHESYYNIRAENDPKAFSLARNFKDSNLCHNVMKEEMISMESNKVIDLVKFLSGVKVIGCKWVFNQTRLTRKH